MLFFGVILLSSILFADTLTYHSTTHSLIGIEGGYGNLGYKYGTFSTKSIGVVYMGLKIGAETEDFRLFLSARDFHASSSKYDYIITYGGELQRKFHLTKRLNIFLGLDSGIANLGFKGSGENFTRTISNPYIGGEVGTNIHLGNSFDWELGGRVLSIQADNIKNGKTYHVNNIASVYTSIIFKWYMD